MKIKISNKIDSEKWDSMVDSFCGNIFHMTVWARFIVIRQPNSSPLFFTFLDDSGKIKGCALGFKDWSQNRLKSYFNRSLWFDSMPLTVSSDPALMCEFLNLIEIYASNQRFTKISIGSFSSENAGNCLNKLHYNTIGRLEFVIPIECSEEETYANVAKIRRDNIKRATNKGLKCVELSNEKSAEELYRINEIIIDRIMDKTDSVAPLSSANILDQYKILLESQDTKAWVAVLNGEVVSIALFGYTNFMATYIAGGSDEKGMKSQASSFLLWSSLQNFKKIKVKNINLGGCSDSAVNKDDDEHGLYLFKKSFGGRVTNCSSGYKVLAYYRYKFLQILKSYKS